MKEEIYYIIFNKIIREGRFVSDSYKIGEESIYGFGIPNSIILKGEKLIITFDNNTKHIIHYSNEVELFTREIQENGTDTNLRTDKKRTRQRKDTK